MTRTRRLPAWVRVGLAGPVLALLSPTEWAGAAEPSVVVGPPVLLEAPPGMRSWWSPTGNGAGAFLLPWESSNFDELWARVFEPSGRPLTPALQVAKAPSGSTISWVASAMDGRGEFLLAWNLNSPTGPLQARRYNADGSPATDTLVLSAAARGVAVALGSDRSFVAAWSVPSGSSERLVVRAFDPAGGPQGPEVLVSEADSLWPGSIEVDALGGILIVYTKIRSLSPLQLLDIWARRFDPSGGPAWPGEIRLSPPSTVADTYFFGGLQLLPDGRRFRVGYQDCDPLGDWCRSAVVVTFGADGAPRGFVNVLPPAYTIDRLGLAADRPGNPAMFGRYWSQPENEPDSLLQVANSEGTDVAAATLVGNQVAHGFGESEVPTGPVATGPGAFVVVWHKRTSSDALESYAQSFTLAPESGSATSLWTVPACRLLDTRETGTPFVAGEDRAYQPSGCGIPAGVKAIVVNATVVAPTAAGSLRFYRPDRLVPETAVLTYRAGDTRGAPAVISLDEVGRYAVRATQASGTAHLVLDVTGYFE